MRTPRISAGGPISVHLCTYLGEGVIETIGCGKKVGVTHDNKQADNQGASREPPPKNATMYTLGPTERPSGVRNGTRRAKNGPQNPT